MSRHQDQTANHILESYVYANAAARTGATGFFTADIGRVAYQQDTGQYWRLTATTPAWQLLALLGQADIVPPVLSVYTKILGVNSNAIADTAIPIVLPAGFTRYRMASLFLSHPNIAITAGQFALSTLINQGGIAIVGVTTFALSSASENANGNLQFGSIINQNTACFNLSTLYFRVTIASGVAGTFDLSLSVNPLP